MTAWTKAEQNMIGSLDPQLLQAENERMTQVLTMLQKFVVQHDAGSSAAASSAPAAVVPTPAEAHASDAGTWE
jgi:hypothetical protein